MSLSRFVDRASSPPGPRRGQRRRHLILALAVLTVAATVAGAGTAQAATTPATASSARPSSAPTWNLLPTRPCRSARSRKPSTRSPRNRSVTNSAPSGTRCSSNPAPTARRRTAELQGRVLHGGRRSRPLAQRRRDQRAPSTSATSATLSGECVALNNFWRSLQNLTINVTTPGFGCYRASSGPCRRPRRCAGSTSSADDAHGLLHRPVLPAAGSSRIPSSTPSPTDPSSSG